MQGENDAALPPSHRAKACCTPAPMRRRAQAAADRPRLRRIDVAVLIALGVERVMIREPRVRVVRTGARRIIGGAAALIASAIEAESGAHAIADDHPLEAALIDEDADAVVAIGGTGSGRNDEAYARWRAPARSRSTASASRRARPPHSDCRPRPVLLLPGRLDAALAGWLTVGRRMLARLAFRLIEEQPFNAELSRKVASPLGLAEVVPVRRRGFPGRAAGVTIIFRCRR